MNYSFEFWCALVNVYVGDGAGDCYAESTLEGVGGGRGWGALVEGMDLYLGSSSALFGIG